MIKRNKHIQLKGKVVWISRKGFPLYMLFFSLLLPGTAIYHLITNNNWLKKEYSKQEVYVQQKDAFEKLSLYMKTVESNSRGYALTGNEQFLRDFNAHSDSINSITLQIKASAIPDETISVAYAKLSRFIDEKNIFLQKANLLTAQNRGSAVLLFSGTEGFNLSDSISIYNGAIVQQFNQQINKSKAVFWQVKNTNNNIAYSSLAAALLLIILSFWLLLKENIRTKRISRELEMQKERYRTTLSSMAEGVITTDKDGGIVYMNPAAEQITGWKKQEAKNQPLHQVYDVSVESTGLRVTNIVTRILKEGVPIELENNTVLKTRNSDELIISNSGSPLFDNEGNINGAVLVFNDITTEKKNKLDLKESEEKYRNLIDHAADGIFILDQQGRFIDVNSSGCEMIGYTKEEVLHLNLRDITPKEFVDKMPVNMNDLIIGKTLLIERQYKRKDGSIFYAEASAKLIAGGKIQSIVRDITQRKKGEEELKQSEERYRMFIEQATDAVLVYSYDGTIHDFNTAAYKQTGYTREEFKTLKLQDLLFDEAVLVNSGVVARVKAGEQVLFTRKLKRKDGSIAEIEINSRMLSDGRVLAFVRDITERKKTEVQIKNISERLSLATRSAKIGIWERDLVLQQLLWDDRMYELFGTDRALFGGTIEEWKQCIHPDDLEGVLHEVSKSINGISDCNTEYRVILPDQTIRYLESHALVTRDDEGKPLRMIGVNRDITERKMAGLQLAESERKLRHVLSSSSESFYVLDKNYTVILINKSASANLEKAWGKPVTVGTNILPLIPEEQDEPVRENLAKVFAGKNVEYELQLSIVGLPEWVQVNYMPVKDGKGIITGAYISTKDITERKKTEKALRESELLTQNILTSVSSHIAVVDEDGTVIAVNKAWNDFSKQNGISVMERTGTGSNYIHVCEQSAAAGDTVAAKVLVGMQQVMSKQLPWFEIEYPCDSPNELRWFLLRITNFVGDSPKVVMVHIDITERKHSEMKLQKALDRYNILAKATSDTVWDWDMHSHMMRYNEGIATMFGYEKSVVENVPDWWKQNIHPDDLGTVSEILDEVFITNKQNIQLSYRFLCSDGNYKYIFDRAFVLYDEQGKPTRIIGAMQDVTYEKEEEIRISKAIVDAQESERQQLGMELHDNVNQILSVSLLYLGIARQHQKNETVFAETIDTCKKHISDAIDEIRKLSHQLTPASKDNVSFKDVFQSLIESLTSNCSMAVHLHFGDFEQELISIEIQTALYRILQEQMNNIFKHAAADTVEIDVMVLENTISLRIADNGKGFDTKSVSKGIGLGNIKRRAEMNGGKFSCYSIPEHGCEVMVSIPLKTSE